MCPVDNTAYINLLTAYFGKRDTPAAVDAWLHYAPGFDIEWLQWQLTRAFAFPRAPKAGEDFDRDFLARAHGVIDEAYENATAVSPADDPESLNRRIALAFIGLVDPICGMHDLTADQLIRFIRLQDELFVEDIGLLIRCLSEDIDDGLIETLIESSGRQESA